MNKRRSEKEEVEQLEDIPVVPTGRGYPHPSIWWCKMPQSLIGLLGETLCPLEDGRGEVKAYLGEPGLLPHVVLKRTRRFTL